MTGSFMSTITLSPLPGSVAAGVRSGVRCVTERWIAANDSRPSVSTACSSSTAATSSWRCRRADRRAGVAAGRTVEPDPAGHLACKDPTDSRKLEVSYLACPPLPPDVPPLTERLRQSLEGEADPSTCSPAVAFRRGPVEFAWMDYVFDSDDPE